MKPFYTFNDLQNWEEVTRDEAVPIRLGIFGNPVAHSHSPEMQNAALVACGIASRYARFAIRESELQAAIQRVRELGFIGLNFTVPHKVRAREFADVEEDSVERGGGINTAAFDDGKFAAFNTDGAGFVDSVREVWPELRLTESRVLVLGVGGAGRAIAAECARVGCGQLLLFNRSPEIASLVAADLAEKFPGCAPTIVASPKAGARDARLIVNATVVGLNSADAPLLMRDDLRSGHFVYDTIYNPPVTRLLAEGNAIGARTANGLTMLLHQGARAFEIWFGRPAPIEVMRAALTSAAKLA